LELCSRIELISTVNGESAADGRDTSKPETAVQFAPFVYTSPGLDLSPARADVREVIREWRYVFRVPNQSRKTIYLIFA
jgi:hypothetical protein